MKIVIAKKNDPDKPRLNREWFHAHVVILLNQDGETYTVAKNMIGQPHLEGKLGEVLEISDQ